MAKMHLVPHEEQQKNAEKANKKTRSSKQKNEQIDVAPSKKQAEEEK